MAQVCTEFANTVDEAKRKLEETAAEMAAAIAGGAVLTFFTLGVSDAVGDAAAAALTSASVKAAFGDPQDSVSPSASEVAWATVLGGVGGVIGTSVAGAAATAVNALGATYAQELSSLDSQLPGMVAAIPDALDTPAGKALLNLASASAATAVTGQSTDPPSVEDILGEVLDSKIESAADKAGEAEE